MLQTILSIAGKPGLYKLVSHAKTNLIVESLDGTHKRLPAFATDRVTSLADISMFTETEDIPLGEVLAKVRDNEGGKVISFNWRKASGKQLQDFLPKYFPNSTAIVSTTATSRNYCNGTTFLSMPASPTLRRT